jgi:hypothetical protein
MANILRPYYPGNIDLGKWACYDPVDSRRVREATQ